MRNVEINRKYFPLVLIRLLFMFINWKDNNIIYNIIILNDKDNNNFCGNILLLFVWYNNYCYCLYLTFIKISGIIVVMITSVIIY